MESWESLSVIYLLDIEQIIAFLKDSEKPQGADASAISDSCTEASFEAQIIVHQALHLSIQNTSSK